MEIPPQSESEGSLNSISKNARKKEAAKIEKLRRQQERELAATAAATAAAAAIPIEDEVDLLADRYGDVQFADLQSKEPVDPENWTKVSGLVAHPDKQVLIRGRVYKLRPVGKNMVFVVVREQGFTVQCVVTAQPNVVSRQMVKFVAGLSRESLVDILGIVSIPSVPITGTTQQVEVQVRQLYCISRAVATLPFNLEDAARSEVEIESALEVGEQLVRVNQDTRLDHRYLDLRTPANQAIFDIESEVVYNFIKFLRSEGFKQIRTPKLMAGSSEGGASVFKLDYKGSPACLAQSPQLYKQMAISADFGRVYEIGAVYRAEDSYTHRHLCEFTGLDVEMEIKSHYSEVMDLVDRLFVNIFDSLNENCSKELEAVNNQYPFKPLQYLPKTLRLTFKEGIRMLKEAGVDADPFGDLNTEMERELGKLVLKKYNTEFYILHSYPSAVRPFYTMPSYDNAMYSNSFDVFIRGEEIISGAQRIHEAERLTKRAQSCGIDVTTISSYIDSFRCGMPPHGGFGAGLERVVMLFLGLNNIRKTSLFPRDPKRITP